MGAAFITHETNLGTVEHFKGRDVEKGVGDPVGYRGIKKMGGKRLLVKPWGQHV